MIPRITSKNLLRLSAQYPVVTVLGQTQLDTTLVLSQSMNESLNCTLGRHSGHTATATNKKLPAISNQNYSVMKRKTATLLSLTFLFIYSFSCKESVKQSFVYPPTPEQPVSDTIFGKVVTDNYRWMEDLESQQMKSWLKSQADFTDSILNKIPGRDLLIEEFKQIDKLASFEIWGPIHVANRYFYGKILSGENIVRLFYREGENGDEVLLFDPLTYKETKSDTVKFWCLPSRDGKKLVMYIRSESPHINTTRIFNVDSKTFYPESIYPGSSWENWTTCWTPDSKGIIYLCPPDKRL